MNTARHTLLRQGRGAGYLAAIEDGADEEVIDCVMTDPRWDRQVEQRSDYYARLLLELGWTGARLSRWVESHTPLVEAREPSLRMAVVKRLNELGNDVPEGNRNSERTQTQGHEDRTADPQSAVAAPPRVGHADLTTMTTAQILQQATNPTVGSKLLRVLASRQQSSDVRSLLQVARGDAVEPQIVAIEALGQLGVAELIPDAESFLRAQTTHQHSVPPGARLRVAFLRYLCGLPAEVTLPLARRWIDEPWPLSLAADRLFAQHASGDDREALERAGTAALHQVDMYRVCSVVDALNTAGPEPSFPFLVSVYQEAAYSFARMRAILAMAACSSGGPAEPWLTEALWDCEPQSRATACRAATSGSPVVRKRICALASDPHESPHVRTAASDALDRLDRMHRGMCGPTDPGE